MKTSSVTVSTSNHHKFRVAFGEKKFNKKSEWIIWSSKSNKNLSMMSQRLFWADPVCVKKFKISKQELGNFKFELKLWYVGCFQPLFKCVFIFSFWRLWDPLEMLYLRRSRKLYNKQPLSSISTWNHESHTWTSQAVYPSTRWAQFCLTLVFLIHYDHWHFHKERVSVQWRFVQLKISVLNLA